MLSLLIFCFFCVEHTSAQISTIYHGCNVYKTCFGSTDSCVSEQNCEILGGITVIGERYEFEVAAKGKPLWVGVGLSDDTKMGDDSVLECVNEGGTVKSYMSQTSVRPYTTTRVESTGFELLDGSIVDDSLYCKIRRDMITKIGDKEYNLNTTKYHLLLAAGTKLKENRVDYHDIARHASGTPIDLLVITEVSGNSNSVLLRLHGAFMLAAWIGTASLGTFVARYYRKTWVGKTMCGKELWFAWHRIFMISTWVLTCAAFVIIFVEFKGWAPECTPHAILGCIVTGLCFVQPIGAFFRPHPGTPRRTLFNWFHFIAGNAAHVLAIVVILLAVRLVKAELPDWFTWILVAFAAFHFMMHLILAKISCVAEDCLNNRVNIDYSTKNIAKIDELYSTERKTLLWVYVVVVSALTITLIVVAVLAPFDETIEMY